MQGPVSPAATFGSARLALEIKLSILLDMEIKACHDAHPNI
jgi:hypothetical protein